MKKLKLGWRILITGIAALALAIVIFRVVTSGVRPDCNRAFDGAFQQWAFERGSTNAYPNAGGLGSNSLAVIEPFVGGEIQRYGYVPGLNFDDPHTLVLMYLKSKTRYTWHGDLQHTIFSPARWRVVSPGIIDGGSCPEGGDLVDTPELKRRLLFTLEYLREKQRPYWQTVSNEQMAFLQSIKE